MDIVRKVGYLLLSGGLMLLLYIFFHELGHLIVMISAGVTITEFSILGAHVSGIGGTYTTASAAMMNVNGALLPVVLSFLYTIFYQRKCRNTFYRIFSYLVAITPIASLLAWVMVPVLYLQGKAPIGDDITKFLDHTAEFFPPLAVSLVATAVIAAGGILVWKKGLLKNFQEAIKGERVAAGEV